MIPGLLQFSKTGLYMSQVIVYAISRFYRPKTYLAARTVIQLAGSVRIRSYLGKQYIRVPSMTTDQCHDQLH